MLGRYIANNTYLTYFELDRCNLTDEKMAVLFGELTNSKSLQRLIIHVNGFGIEGIRSMVPFLQNSPQLISLWLRFNQNVNTECFELVISTLHETQRSDITLNVEGCNITNISSLSTYKLPNLQMLNLNGNEIGRQGCIVISNLLQKEGSSLEYLDLENTNIDDEGAEILAASLKNNTKLSLLGLRGNGITQRGHEAFSKLLVNVSSIDNTYKSNHTLIELYLDYGVDDMDHKLLVEGLNK